MVTVDLVQTYLVNCERRGLSQATLRWYGFFLKNFARQYPELPLKPEPIEEFIYSHKTGDERRYGAFRCLRAFYNFVESRIFIEQKLDLDNPFHHIIPPRRSQKEKWSLNLEELRRLLEYPNHDPIIKTLLYFLADTGVRISEAVSVASDDMGADSVRVRGKTGERIVPISSKVRQMLLQLGPGRLFPHKPHWWSMEVSRAFREVGLPGTAHTLRHSFVSIYDGNDRSLMTITGHRSFQMIQNYSHRKLESAKEQHGEHGPMAKLYGPEQKTCKPTTIAPSDNGSLDRIIGLAEELGMTKEQLKHNGNGKQKVDDLADFITNMRGLPGSYQVAEAKFFFHSVVYNFAQAVSGEGGYLQKLSALHALAYLRDNSMVPDYVEKMEPEEEAINFCSGMVDMIGTFFEGLASQHYELALAYGKLAREKRGPEWFNFFNAESNNKDIELGE